MTKYKHKEAFALMWYACPCGHRERIWNSRDGVTPFGGVLCPSCGGKGLQQRGLTHVDWHLDEPASTHQLFDGQRFFRDGITDEAVAIIGRRIARYDSIPSAVATSLLEDAKNCCGEWQPGWPMTDRYAVPKP